MFQISLTKVRPGSFEAEMAERCVRRAEAEILGEGIRDADAATLKEGARFANVSGDVSGYCAEVVTQGWEGFIGTINGITFSAEGLEDLWETLETLDERG